MTTICNKEGEGGRRGSQVATAAFLLHKRFGCSRDSAAAGAAAGAGRSVAAAGQEARATASHLGLLVLGGGLGAAAAAAAGAAAGWGEAGRGVLRRASKHSAAPWCCWVFKICAASMMGLAARTGTGGHLLRATTDTCHTNPRTR